MFEPEHKAPSSSLVNHMMMMMMRDDKGEEPTMVAGIKPNILVDQDNDQEESKDHVTIGRRSRSKANAIARRSNNNSTAEPSIDTLSIKTERDLGMLDEHEDDVEDPDRVIKDQQIMSNHLGMLDDEEMEEDMVDDVLDDDEDDDLDDELVDDEFTAELVKINRESRLLMMGMKSRGPMRPRHHGQRSRSTELGTCFQRETDFNQVRRIT